MSCRCRTVVNSAQLRLAVKAGFGLVAVAAGSAVAVAVDVAASAGVRISVLLFSVLGLRPAGACLSHLPRFERVAT